MNPVLQLLTRRHQPAPTPSRATMGQMIRYVPGSTALVLDSPHSGVDYPPDFGHCRDLADLRRAEDTHVEKLYDFAPDLGAAWIEALFPRSYIDVNRNTTEIDTSMFEQPWPDPVETDPATLGKVRLGKGLVWRCTDEGLPIYDRALDVEEVRRRIDRCWKPYHAALAHAIDAAHARHGYCIHLDCHSMPAVSASHATEFPGLVHPDFVVGDRDGTCADPDLSQQVCEHLRSLGYDVGYNHPYRGAELVRRHGGPARQRHSIQLEINRRLYMNERTLEPGVDFDRLRQDLRSLVEALLHMRPPSAA